MKIMDIHQGVDTQAVDMEVIQGVDSEVTHQEVMVDTPHTHTAAVDIHQAVTIKS